MTTSVLLSMIVARAKNGVIGKDGDLPWRLRDDLKHFKETTEGFPIIMGRRTWESFPKRPLPKRENIVLTRDWSYRADGARVYTTLDAALVAGKALAATAGLNECFIIGGRTLYEACLPLADRLYMTEVDAEIEGDTVFPSFDEADFTQSSSQFVAADERNDHAFQIRVLDRKT